MAVSLNVALYVMAAVLLLVTPAIGWAPRLRGGSSGLAATCPLAWLYRFLMRGAPSQGTLML